MSTISHPHSVPSIRDTACLKAVEQSRDALLAALEALLKYEGTVDQTGIGELPSEELIAARKHAQAVIAATHEQKTAGTTSHIVADFVAQSADGVQFTTRCKVDLRIGEAELSFSADKEKQQAKQMTRHRIRSETGREFSLVNFGGDYVLADLKGFLAHLSQSTGKGAL